MSASAVPVHRTTAEVNGIRVHYAEAGGGAPVVLLHGFPETWYAWRHQVPVLAERYRVIVPDLRGYGDTTKPAAGYDKRTMASDLAALLASLGIARIALIGHDRGARVATRFAKDHPELLDRLAVLDDVPTRVVAEQLSAATVAAVVLRLQPGSEPARGADRPTSTVSGGCMTYSAYGGPWRTTSAASRSRRAGTCRTRSGPRWSQRSCWASSTAGSRPRPRIEPATASAGRGHPGGFGAMQPS